MNKQRKYLATTILSGILLCSNISAVMVTSTNFALIHGIRERNIDQISQEIVSHGKDVVNTCIGAGISPLHIAAALDEAEIALMLLNSGADVNAVTDGGFTPLHWAAGKNSSDITTLLLRHGADIEAKTANGITPLHWAANNNATNVIKVLLVSGAKPLPKTLSGQTPLHWAVSRRSDAAAVSLAYQVVTDQMASEPNVIKASNPINYNQNIESIITLSDNSHKNYTPRRSLTVALDLKEKLKFTWIESLNLWVGTYEVNNAQYRKYNPEHNSLFYENFSLNDDNQPVVYVSWDDANSFCNWLNKNYHDKIPLGSKFRLPTNSEWEFIAKCGENRIYPWGDNLPPKEGNLSDLTARLSFANWKGIRLYDDGYAVTCPVTKCAANKWGIHGLAGNVREWCNDWYDKEHTLKIRHGGCWDFDSTTSLKINSHGFDRPEAKYDTIGFRIVLAKEK